MVCTLSTAVPYREDEEAIKEMGISEEQKIEIKWKLMDILKEK